MKRFLLGAAIAIAVLVGGFFLLNHYIYWEKQADDSDTANVVPEESRGVPTFTWSYRDFEDKYVPYSEISLTANYENSSPVTKVIETIEGNCNTYEEADSDTYEGSTMIICYYAGFGRYYKVVKSGEEYVVQRKEFDEGSPDYDTPVQPYRDIERF